MRGMSAIMLVICSFPAFSTLQAGNGVSTRLEINTDHMISGGRVSQQSWPQNGDVCWYNNKRYSEGAVLSVGDINLQCGRDKNVISTSPLLWRTLSRK